MKTINIFGDTLYYKDGTTVLHREDGPACVGKDGVKEWWVNGKRHREDGPAIEYADGLKEWWQNDLRHRLDGPAIEYADGSKEWWIKGKQHREDGPAVEYADGLKEWFYNGEYINCTSQSAFDPLMRSKKLELERFNMIKKIKIDKKLPLLMAGHLQDRQIKQLLRLK